MWEYNRIRVLSRTSLVPDVDTLSTVPTFQSKNPRRLSKISKFLNSTVLSVTNFILLKIGPNNNEIKWPCVNRSPDGDPVVIFLLEGAKKEKLYFVLWSWGWLLVLVTLGPVFFLDLSSWVVTCTQSCKVMYVTSLYYCILHQHHASSINSKMSSHHCSGTHPQPEPGSLHKQDCSADHTPHIIIFIIHQLQ